MTQMIYRGAAYIRTSKTAQRIPQDLIYRGVRHDGMTAQSARRATEVEMSYRGVAYTMAPDGRIAVQTQPAAHPVHGAAALGN